MEVLLLFIIGVFVLFYVYASFTTGPSPTGNFVSPSE